MDKFYLIENSSYTDSFIERINSQKEINTFSYQKELVKLDDLSRWDDDDFSEIEKLKTLEFV